MSNDRLNPNSLKEIEARRNSRGKVRVERPVRVHRRYRLKVFKAESSRG